DVEFHRLDQPIGRPIILKTYGAGFFGAHVRSKLCVPPRSLCVNREAACVEMSHEVGCCLYILSSPPALMAFQQAASRCIGPPTTWKECDRDAARNLLAIGRGCPLLLPSSRL